MKLSGPEKAIFSEAAAGLDELPTWLEHRLCVYAKMLHQWRLSADRLSKAKPENRYKLAQECAMFARQFETAQQAIEREREKQAERRRSRDEQQAAAAGSGKVKAYWGETG